MTSSSSPLSFSSVVIAASTTLCPWLKLRRLALLCYALAVWSVSASRLAAAQDASATVSAASLPRPLITAPLDESRRIVLKGNTHPLARLANDRGSAPDSQPMRRMILVLKRSAEQEAALRSLLDTQQTPGSQNYHRWLTPAQFGRQFGPADSDLEAVKAWLESHGFQVAGVSQGRTTIEFSGTAGQVQQAFRTPIHSFEVNGEQHWANVSDPSIPSALAPVVHGVLSLHNFPRHAQSTVHATPVPSRATASGTPSPLFTYTSGKSTLYGVGPTDFATIYNVLPLWNAGIDGTGQTIAIVGETNIHLSDIETFRSIFGLPAKDPKVIVNGPDPGIIGDEPEAVLDVSWSGAIARNATIDLVVSATTESSLGVDLSALYIVDNNLAPVLSESYGECETTLGNSGNAFYNALWQQAAAQGITVVVAAGDGGSAGCDDFNSQSFALDGLAVSGFASTPYNVAVGGTDFNQTPATASKYWSATNNSATGASALGYIPETTWNQSCAGLGAGNCTYSGNDLNIVAGSGGPSSCSTLDSTGACTAGYGKPAWQTGTGVPQDGVRDLPDVSLFASAGFNNSFYIMCEGDLGLFGIITGMQNPCSLTNNQFIGMGGTSAAAPAFAGILALVNQKTAARQGNANYALYNLAAQSGASCNSSTAPASGSSCVFYDVTAGNNSVPCAFGSPNCGAASTNGYGILVDPNNPANPAWTAGPGYDLATGLGSVNAANLVNAWSTAAFTPTTTTLTNVSPMNLVHGQTVNVSATVAPQSGSGTPTGSVALMAAPTGQSLGLGSFSLVNGAATGNTSVLPGGTYNVTAHYPGDGVFAASDSAPVQVTVAKENSQTVPTLEVYSLTSQNVSQGFTATNTVPYGSVFFLRSDVTNAAGASCAPNPTQTGVGCPTGTVKFTLNGSPLDMGSYSLNTQGYAEDQSLALEFTSVGAYSIQAQYGGDASYNPSSAAFSATVAPGPTFLDYFEITDLTPQYNSSGLPTYIAWSGQLFHVLASARDQSVLAAPTGTISILENGSPAPGTPALNPFNGSYSGGFSSLGFGYLQETLPITIDTPGSYTFTASYPGDAHYAGSQAAYPLAVTVQDTTFNITPPVPNVTIAAPGQSGTTTVTLAGVDNFAGQVAVTCTLPAAMTEATCPSATAVLGNVSTAAVPLTITTTGPHKLAQNHVPGMGAYGFGVLACTLLFVFPGRRQRNLFAGLVLLACLASLGGCGGSSTPTTQTDAGTPAGTYTVNITAASMNITRTATFTVTVQ